MNVGRGLTCTQILCLGMSNGGIACRLTFFAVFVIIEYLAFGWYTLSYIPYARTAVLKAVGMGG